MKKVILYSSFTLMIIIILIALMVRINVFNMAGIDAVDFAQHFAEMRIHYEDGSFPALGSKLEMSRIFDATRPRVPGGIFYLYYLMCYKLGFGNFEYARAINLVLMLIPGIMFVFWAFRRFGSFVAFGVASLVLMNAYYAWTSIIFFNPNITLAFSFLFLILFAEYTGQKDARIPAMMFFPILALMWQSHLAVMHGILPTVLVYLIIRHKRTIKYIRYLTIGVFISFLTYIPYFAYEFRTGFSNVRNAIEYMKITAAHKPFPFPQIHSLLMFPTNEFSVLYSANNFNKIADFWTNNNPFIYIGLPLLAISIIFVFACFFISVFRFFKNKDFKYVNDFDIKDESYNILKELMLLFLLYFPVTILSTIFLKGVAGQFRYHYGAFALAFVPIIYTLYFLKNKNKNKIVLTLIVFFAVNAFAMYLNIYQYFKYYHSYRLWKDYRNTAETITKDSNGEYFTIANPSIFFTENGMAYNKSGTWKETNNANIIYFVQNKNEYTNIENAKLIVDNNIYVIFRKDK